MRKPQQAGANGDAVIAVNLPAPGQDARYCWRSPAAFPWHAPCEVTALVKKPRPRQAALVRSERIERTIVRLRGHNVMLDADLAVLYGVDTRALVQAVRRNVERFPPDFMFQLSPEEVGCLRSQFVISKIGRGGRRTAPHAFTEEGVAMLSSVLRSARAVRVNIAIMRAFVRLRQILQSHADLARQVEALERKYDGQFEVVFEAIRELMTPPPMPRKRIGFRPAKG